MARGLGFKRSLNPKPIIAPSVQDSSPRTTTPIPTSKVNSDEAPLADVAKVKPLDSNAIPRTDDILTIPMILRHLKEFDSVADQIARINSYAKAAMNILTCASKMIIDHSDRNNDALFFLLAKVSDVYVLLTEKKELAEEPFMLEMYGKMARQTLECADFIVHYSETIWKRLSKNVYKEKDGAIQSYIDVLNGLIRQFRERRTSEIIHHHTAGCPDFSDMVYAPGAGLDVTKCCLSDTREDILSRIKSWVCSTGEDVPRILWLSGQAGTGKSAIAHTITKWFNELGCVGACFCFDPTRGTDRRHEKIFTTIARDLAACDPFVRRALGRAIHNDNMLKHSTDLAQQWHILVIGPIGEALKAVASPILIVIDGLNESGEGNSQQILRLLAGGLDTSPPQLNDLTAHFRIFVTSVLPPKQEDDVNVVPHVKHISINDIPTSSATRDIQLYISVRLAGSRNSFDDGHFETLARKSDNSFEWARVACEYIKGATKVGLDPMVRFERMCAGTSENGTPPLDVIYRHILEEIIPEDERGEMIPMFCSVMGQILASEEPLSMTALTAMRQHFPSRLDWYDVARIIERMETFITGTADSHTPIHPHASFSAFLKDKSRSRDFFVDVSLAHKDLAFASLRIMKSGLHFNICSLKNSYLPNSAVRDLESRVEATISAELSYSCRFWGTHVQASSFESLLAKEIEDFFYGERLLFWLEALALLKDLNGPDGFLLSFADRFKDDADYIHISKVARDAHEFVRIFRTTISHSTPHLYVSALPFAPPQSTIYNTFVKNFPRIPRVVSIRGVKRPLTTRARAGVMSVAISPGRKHIVGGLYDGTITLWDMERGESVGDFRGHKGAIWSVAVSQDGACIVSGSNDWDVRVWDGDNPKASGTPLKGHDGAVRSVVISVDGKLIASGSDDNTIRIWLVKDLKARGSPLRGHIASVLSVAISLDGTRIVSGSADHTVRVWDVKTGNPLCAPFEGHTDWVQSVALSRDGNIIVSGSGDMTIQMWCIEPHGKWRSSLNGHTDDIMSVALSPDKNYIVSGSADNTIRVWDTNTCEAFGAPLLGHADYVRSVVLSQDGRSVVSGSDDTTVSLWNLELPNHEVFGGPTKDLSSNLTHPFFATPSFQGFYTQTSLTKDGWLVGPEGQLLLFIPADFYPSIAHNMVVISSSTSQLDLSRVAHGPSWFECRE